MTVCKILLVGCGQLGSRHLQAIATLGEVGEIHVVDPRPESLELARARLREVSDANPAIVFQWHTEPMACCTGGDLCIVATQAKGRPALVKGITAQFGYKKFLIEKVVSQSILEYQDLMQYCAARGIKVWVNCKSRAYGIHQYIKTKLNPVEPIFFSDVGGSHGLANNGIHAADLFAFYDDALKILPAGVRIDPVLLPSKRGPEVFDLGGSMYGTSTKGSDFVLSFSGPHVSPDIISIISPRGRFLVDHFHKFAMESYPETNWQWQRVPIDENWAVSHMTKKFAFDLLTKGVCTLPTLEECFPAHEFILNGLLPEFNRLRGTHDETCPVT